MNLKSITHLVNTSSVNGSHHKETHMNLNEFWTYPSLQGGHVVCIGCYRVVYGPFIDDGRLLMLDPRSPVIPCR